LNFARRGIPSVNDGVEGEIMRDNERREKLCVFIQIVIVPDEKVPISPVELRKSAYMNT
jgi:hypothetical protein